MKVMIVEDSPTQALRAKMALTKAGCTVTVVDNAREALEHMHNDAPDVVYSDVKMPGMDGFELVEAIKSDEAISSIPIVLASATVNEEEDKEYALMLGASDYLEKGIAADELVAALKAAHDA